MSALHAAVARAIAAANCGGDVSAYCYEARADCECRLAAAAAVRVVLAEATRSIEALRAADPRPTGVWGEPRWAAADEARLEALAVLAALGEQA